MNGELTRIFQYSGEQIGWIVITASLNMAALVCKTISSQNEKSGVVTMFGYIGIVYACLGDYFIFDEMMNWLEWLGVAVIICTTVTLTLHLLLSKKKKAPTDDGKDPASDVPLHQEDQRRIGIVQKGKEDDDGHFVR